MVAKHAISAPASSSTKLRVNLRRWICFATNLIPGSAFDADFGGGYDLALIRIFASFQSGGVHDVPEEGACFAGSGGRVAIVESYCESGPGLGRRCLRLSA